jgi:hypothetical protein
VGGNAQGGSVSSGDANANGGNAYANGGDWATAVAITKGSEDGKWDPCGGPCGKGPTSDESGGANTANAGNGGTAEGGDGGFANSGNAVLLSGNALAIRGYDSKRGLECPPPCPPPCPPAGSATGGSVTSGDANANGGSAYANGGNGATAIAVAEYGANDCPPCDPCPPPCDPCPPPCEPKPCPPPCDGGGV